MVGIIGSIITVLTFLQNQRDKRTLAALEKQIEDAKELGKSYKDNISSITGLVNTMKGVLDLFSEAREMVETVKKLREGYEKGETHWNREIEKLNRLAVTLSPRCKRRAHNQPDIQRAVRDFSFGFENVDGSVGLDGKVNANCYFILSFHNRIEGGYDEAVKHLDQAIALAKDHKAALKQYQHLYPELPDKVGLDIWLTKLQNICHYHLAIIVYNLGRYQDALSSFKEAIKCDPLDYESFGYIPEVMFLGRLGSFAKIVQEFENAADEIQKLSPEEAASFSKSREQLLAQVYLKLANCYTQYSPDTEFAAYRDLDKAEQRLKQAYRLDPKSPIIAFSLAQVFHLRNREEKQRRELFKTVFDELKAQMGNIAESKIRVMYYYILGIACFYGTMESEIPQLYTMRIYELAHQLPKPKELRVFSPLTKRDLSVTEFLTEVRGFEAETAMHTGPRTGFSRRASTFGDGGRR